MSRRGVDGSGKIGQGGVEDGKPGGHKRVAARGELGSPDLGAGMVQRGDQAGTGNGHDGDQCQPRHGPAGTGGR